MNRFTFMIGALALPQALLSSAPAFAFRGDGANMALTRHDNDRKPAALSVRIEGQLTCHPSVAANQANAECELKLLETSTGRIYQLSDSTNAMRLFQSGTRNVAVMGNLENADTISVKNAEAL